MLFVGAGSSKMVGYPTWGELIRELERVAAACGDGFVADPDILGRDPLEFLAYVDAIKAHIHARTGNNNALYHTFLVRTFGERGFAPLETHHQMVRMPFRGIITTNYDFVLEAALVREFKESGHTNSLDFGIDHPFLIKEFLQRLTVPGQQRQVLHIHGCNRSPAHMVLGLADYQAAYADGSLLRDVMHTILTSYKLVFVGFSLTDPYFRGLLARVVARFELKGVPMHFAITDISPGNAPEQKTRANQLQLEYSTEVVFYERLDETHRGLRDLITELEHAIPSVSRRVGIEALNDAVAAEIIR